MGEAAQPACNTLLTAGGLGAQMKRARAWFPCLDTPAALCTFDLQVGASAVMLFLRQSRERPRQLVCCCSLCCCLLHPALLPTHHGEPTQQARFRLHGVLLHG